MIRTNGAWMNCNLVGERDVETKINKDGLLEDIHDINLSYLLLMQRLINSDREQAMFRSKIDEEMADLLSTVSISELAQLARCDQLLCQFSLSSASQLDALVNVSKNEEMRQLHAAILMSGQENRESERRQDERRLDERRLADRRLVARPGTDRRSKDRRSTDRRTTPRRTRDVTQPSL